MFGLPDPAVTVAFSPDGKTIATSGHPKARIWDVVTHKEIRSVEGWGCLAFSSDGKMLATGTMHQGEVSWWDTGTGKKLHSVSGQMEIFSLAFSPDGKILAGGDTRGQVTGGRVHVWDVATGEERHTLAQP